MEANSIIQEFRDSDLELDLSARFERFRYNPT